LRPNKRVQPTPLCGRKIGGILKPGFGSTAFPIERCGAADAQGVGPLLLPNARVVDNGGKMRGNKRLSCSTTAFVAALYCANILAEQIS
jgi:hypothetical protein